MAHCDFRCVSPYGMCSMKLWGQCPYGVHNWFRKERDAIARDHDRRRPINDCPEAHPCKIYREDDD